MVTIPFGVLKYRLLTTPVVGFSFVGSRRSEIVPVVRMANLFGYRF